jgi:hypothetical protein
VPAARGDHDAPPADDVDPDHHYYLYVLDQQPDHVEHVDQHDLDVDDIHDRNHADQPGYF